MLFEVTELVKDVMGPQTDKNKYDEQFIIDVLLEYVTSNAAESYIGFSLDHIWMSKHKTTELVKRATNLRENMSKSNRITSHDAITDAVVIFDGIVSGIGGYLLFITPHSKLYDVLKDDPKKLTGRIFIETLVNGVDVNYLEISSCVPMWITSKSSKQFLRNLEYRRIKFNRIKNALLAAEAIQDYREKTGE